MSQTNALGQLTDVWEITASDDETESITFTGRSEVTAGYRTKYEYNTLGSLTKVTQQIGTTGTIQERTFSYDTLSRLLSAANPESGTISYSYDNNGNLLTKTDARSIVSTYVYDALNRPATRSYSESTPTVTYSYDSTSITNGIGRLSSISSSVSSYNYGGYDALGRAGGGTQTINSHPYSVGYTYDKAGHVLTQTYPSGHTVTNTYDGAGRETSVAGNLGEGGSGRNYSSGIIYDSAGRMTKEQLGTTTPIYNKLFYNVRGQLAEIRESTSYTGPTDDTFDRGAIINHYSDSCWGMCGGSNSTTSMTDNNGNLRKQEIHIPSQTMKWQQYDYDSLNRLNWVREIVGEAEVWRQTFAYDRFGNRTINTGSATHGGVNNLAFEVEPGSNRLYSPGDLALTDASRRMRYDLAGNQIKNYYGDPNYLNYDRTYDAENRMNGSTATDSYGSQISTYTYDGDGRRVKRKVGSIETWQVYGLGGELLAEYAENANYANPQKEYGYRNGQMLIEATVPAGSGGSAPTFSDDPLVAQETVILLAHLTELRNAVDQLRARAGLPAGTYTTDPNPTRYVTEVHHEHIIQLRAALEPALAALHLPTGGYAHTTISNGDPIYAIDFQELRNQIKAAYSLKINWLVTDQLGTPRMIFDQSGSLASTSRHDYLPFGEELFAGTGGRTTTQGYSLGPDAPDGVRQQFTQKERDNETGLDYFLARYYSSTQGRFTSPDEFAGGPDQVGVLGSGDSEKQALPCAEITNPQSLNKYQYSFNCPLRYTDLDGHDPQDPPKPGVIDKINDVFAALWRNFERQKDQIREDEPRRGAVGIGDKQIQIYMDEKGKALQSANDVMLVADFTGVVTTLQGFQTGNKQQVAIGMLTMAFRFRGAGLALSHFKKHGAEFGLKNAVQYVKAASGFVDSRGGDVARYVNAAGKVLVYNKVTNQFATHTGKTIHTYFKPTRGLDYVKDVIKKEGYKLIQ